MSDKTTMIIYEIVKAFLYILLGISIGRLLYVGWKERMGHHASIP